MVTSSAVVGSSAISREGLQDKAIAIMTRWRIPPESWCGYHLRILAWLQDTDKLKHPESFGLRLRVAEFPDA